MSETPAPAPTRPAPAGPARSRLARTVLALVLTGAVVVLAAQGVRRLGPSWSSVLGLLRGLSLGWLALLSAIWLLGLVAHTLVLTASLPGLTHRRALTLNLTGSAVSNVLPLGGAVGTGLNLAMIRAWGFTPADFVRFTVVSKAWDVLSKLSLPLAVVLLLAGTGHLPDRVSRTGLFLGVAGLGLLGAGLLAVLAGRARWLVRAAAALERLLEQVLARAGRPRRLGLRERVAAFAETTAGLVRRGWQRLSLGMLAYLLLQGLLLWLSLRAVGADLPLPVVLAGLVAERALTLVGLTPGGVGLVEAGAVGVLVALGAAPSPALAGVLLYRAFVFALEIPVGGAVLGGWLLLGGGRRRLRAA